MNDTHSSNYAQHVAANSHDDDDDDGDLGYYPDGAKRTLTDEQIAMFRHSEIYSIIRARQVKRENDKFDEEEVEADRTSAAKAEETFITRASAPVATKREDGILLNEEYGVTAGARDDAIDDRARPANSRLKRRKLNRERNTEVRGEDVPSRRVIRELDAAVEADEPELDY